jgi:hypothetical protein
MININAPLVYCLIQSQKHEIEVFKKCSLLDLVSEKHGNGVGERSQCRLGGVCISVPEEV